ncbi:hypothetical protein [Henriciella mobilis]|uniref:hypothetical protein n=1 Tax=Henriciella mobilis TaxID=2305467 RepID=UPI0011C3B428|nr:hypothetical protein [Henriciella mobilis]
MSGQLCPLCRIEDDAIFNEWAQYDSVLIDCPACSKYVISQSALADERSGRFWTPVTCAALSYHVRNRIGVPLFRDTPYPFVSNPILTELEENGLRLPSRQNQVNNVIRYLGDTESQLGFVPDVLPDGTWAAVGCPSPSSLGDLMEEMRDIGLLHSQLKVSRTMDSGSRAARIVSAKLTLLGWERWDDIHSGATASKDGFIAMQFGNERLDKFVEQSIQSAVAEHLGIQIHRIDSPGKTKAGLIDNNMREAIEDASFVLVELSHGNLGAYWEAGLAEGLGKPVIYLCEQAVWDDTKTRPHFDVNHRTTIMWDEAKPDEFVTTLVATIKNSLRHRQN